MSKQRPDYTPRPMSSATTYALGGVALAMIVLIVFAVFRWGSSDAEIRNDGYGAVRDPAVQVTLREDGVILLGRPGAQPVLDVFEDPLCPACGTLERVYGQEIAQKVDEGALSLAHHYVAFLDAKSGSGDYSTRAVAATRCVAATGDGPLYARFHDALFVTDQPAEGKSDHSDEALADLARTAGAPDTAVDCITTAAQRPAAEKAVESALADLNARLDDNAATPALFHGDTRLDANNAEWVVELTTP
ncbi:MAG TPA: thioredoxin domain-containing protein [Nocardia sp.]|uniref:DsbA family protein n=1 Tax=Nocardia TaxID=1817 RepID=UPI0024570083|nr:MULTISPECIES: thioredoxin domain-containing protein [Nocardia]HLS75807.1 thioredoxin domain-containing protein [Nocardia sp.]